MAVTNADIQAYYNQNQNTSHAQIAADMDKYGVTPEQFALATGQDVAGITNAYNVAKSSSAPTTNSASLPTQTTQAPVVPTSSATPTYGALYQSNPNITSQMIKDYHANAQKTGMTAAQIAADLDKHGVSTSDYAAATGMNPTEVLFAYLDNTGRQQQADSLREWQRGTNEWLEKGYITSPTGTAPSSVMFSAVDPIMAAKLGFGQPQMASLEGKASQLDKQQQMPSYTDQMAKMQEQFDAMMARMQQPATNPSTGFTPSPSSGASYGYYYQPVYSNPLMRPVTANSNIAPQQAPSNMGYQNRTSLWVDV